MVALMKPDNQIVDSITQGDCLEVLRTLDACSVDACVVDPPYGLGEVKDIAGLLQAWIRDEDDSCYLGKSGFMGKEWDAGVPGPRYWREVLRVMKPGAHILCFASTRTVDLMMIALRLAGFQCRDTLMWVYGCLSEDTEILINGRWEPYHKAIAGSLALCYNVNTQQFGWEPIQEVLTYDYNDTAFRIHSDNTDQLVSRNHRCIVERSGSQVFQYAETLQSEESVPILEDLPALLEALPLPYERASGTKQDVLSGMRQLSACGKATCREATNGATQGLDTGELLSMWQRDMDAESMAQEGERANLLTSLQGSATRARMGKTRPQRTLCLDRREQQILSRENEWSQQSSMEGRRNLLQDTRELCGSEVYPVSSGVSTNGTQGRLCDGASSIRGSGSGAATLERRSGTSQRSQSWEQRSEQSATLCQQFRPQTVRASRYTSTDLATVTPVHYQGVVWCVRVPSGAFVARRNGKVFITGNSGFPKNTNISKKIDKLAPRRGMFTAFAEHLNVQLKASGMTNTQLGEYFKTSPDRINHGGCVTNWAKGYNVPTLEQWNVLQPLLNLSDEWLPLIERIEAEREVIGTCRMPDGKHSSPGFAAMTAPDGKARMADIDITAPATPEARQHAGTGTALKPAHEPIILARKPLSESSIAANVLKWGTGGLAIDQCRVGTHDYTQEQWNKKGEARTTGNAYGVHKGSITPLPQGRFPSNLLLSHSLFCVPLGKRKVKGSHSVGNPKPHQSKDGFNRGGLGTLSFDYVGEDGLEEVQAWECDPSCPVYQLDLQSGIRKGATSNSDSGSDSRGTYNKGWAGTEKRPGYNDQGGASRYFSQFSPQDEVPIPFLYQSKASRSERNRGCEGLPEVERKPYEGGMHSLSDKRMNHEQNRLPASNHHPTVKPLALCKWLIRLICREGGVVLDPFCGSGSILISAIYEHCHYIGIEQEASYVEIARARVAQAFGEVAP